MVIKIIGILGFCFIFLAMLICMACCEVSGRCSDEERKYYEKGIEKEDEK